VFIKGHLTFEIDGMILEFPNQTLSAFGVTGLPWAPLNAQEHFGRQVQVNLLIPQPKVLHIKGPAYLLRESTLYNEHLGLRFQFDADQKSRLMEHINRYGHYPTDYIRKYPRIPSETTIQTFPLQVLARFPSQQGGSNPNQDAPVTFDVQNLSPNGILISTENQIALSIKSGEKIFMVLEPRGWFPMQIKVEGMVCRLLDDRSPQNGNLVRYLGIKFTKVDEVNKTAFLSLLKDILETIKKNPLGYGR